MEAEFVGVRDALGEDILDQQVCCDGNSGPPTYCGCRGETVRDVLAYVERRLTAGVSLSADLVAVDREDLRLDLASLESVDPKVWLDARERLRALLEGSEEEE